MAKDSPRIRDRKKDDDGDKSPSKSAAPKGGASKDPPKKKNAFNRIPKRLTEEFGLPDWVAGSLVIVAGGLIMVIFVYLMILIFPAG